MSLETFQDFVRVSIHVSSPKDFQGSLGLLGRYPDGKQVSRDGSTIIADHNLFGFEWQVLESEPMIFHEEGQVHAPNGCLMPDIDAQGRHKRRRLGETVISMEGAELACAKILEKDQRQDCIFDVVTTQDKEMAVACL